MSIFLYLVVIFVIKGQVCVWSCLCIMDRIFGYFFEFWIFGRIVSVESVYISLDIFRVMSYRKREPDLFLKPAVL